MPFAEHALLAFGGPLGTTGAEVEEWSCSLRMVAHNPPLTPDAITDANWNAATDDVTADVKAWFSSETSIQDAVSLTWVKFNRIGADGRYTKPTTYRRDFARIRGTSTSQSRLPWQCSVVASLTTAATRGRGHIGRMFLPPMTKTVDVDGTISAGDATTIATNLKTLITNLNNWPGLDQASGVNYVVSICSRIDGSTHDVTGVRVGRVIDTHRSRRRSLSESPALVSL